MAWLDWLYAPVPVPGLPDTLSWLEALLLLVSAAGLAVNWRLYHTARRRRRGADAEPVGPDLSRFQKLAGQELARRAEGRQFAFLLYVVAWLVVVGVAATTTTTSIPRSPTQLLTLAVLVLVIGMPAGEGLRDLRSAARVDRLLAAHRAALQRPAGGEPAP